MLLPELRFALEIRNRVVHPTTLVELEVSNGEVQLITQTGLNFYNDFRQFVQWFSQKEQKMLWDLPGNRRRYLKKTGRNESCPLRQRPQIQELLRAGTGVIRLSLPDPGDSQTYPFIFRRVSL